MLANMTLFMADGRQLVSMERFEGLTKKVDCDETMSLEFVSKAAFDYAIRAWGWVNENAEDSFVMIANHDGCGPDQERVPYSITDVDYDEEKFIAYLKGTQMKWTDIDATLVLDYGRVPEGALTRRISKTVSVSISMEKSLGDSLNIWSNKVGNFDLDLNCLKCGTSGSFEISGRVKASLGLFSGIKLKELSLQAQPNNFQARLHLQMAVKGEGSYSNSKRLLTVPLSGAIYIPKIFKLGGTLNYDIGVDASITGSATISYGVIVKLRNSAIMKIDLRSLENSQFSDWSPDFEQIPLEVQASINGRVALYSQPGVSWGISVLDKWGYDVGLEMKLPEIAADLSSNVNSNGGLCGNPTYRASLDYGLSVGADLSFHVGSYRQSLWKESKPLYSGCIGFPS